MDATRERSLSRWRAGLALAALVVPLALFALFERQARRLDALAEQGAPVTANVTRVTEGGTVHYAYWVDGVGYSWNVARDDAPYEPGATFAATYLPDDPSFSRPIADRALAAAEASGNRSFAWKVVLGVGLFLGFFALLTHRDLRRLRAGAPREEDDPAAYRQRLMLVGLALAPLLALILGYHASDALERGESVVPVLFGVVLALSVLGGTLLFVLRRGPGEARARAARLMRWVAPIALGIAALRLVGLAFGV